MPTIHFTCHAEDICEPGDATHLHRTPPFPKYCSFGGLRLRPPSLLMLLSFPGQSHSLLEFENQYMNNSQMYISYLNIFSGFPGLFRIFSRKSERHQTKCV